MTALCLDIWQARPETAGKAVVLPDGCRDLIVRVDPGQAPHWFVSELPMTAETVPFGAQVWMKGFRLQPGVAIDRRLTDEAARIVPDDDRALLGLLDGMCVRSDGVAEALEALSVSASVAVAARRLGVAMRTLQRLILRETGMPPQYFQRLARVRRAARSIDSDVALAEVAFAHGFADQAHFSRECRQGLGVTPKAVKSRADLRAMLALPAYA